jgi:hypothetical protein
MAGVKARVVLLLGMVSVAAGGTMNGCTRDVLDRRGAGGTGGSMSPAGRGGAGTSGSAFGEPACPSTVGKATPCTPDDLQLCYKSCGPERLGVKSETCAGGIYNEMSGCAFDPNKDYSCYAIPVEANAACPAGVTPQASTECTVDHCVLCNSIGGPPGGLFLEASGVPKVGFCVCQPPNTAGVRTWSCASDVAWPCPAGLRCDATPGGGGTGRGGSGATAGTSGSGGITGRGGNGAGGRGQGGSGGPFNPSCTGLITAAGIEPTKGASCSTPGDPQLCYKTCGPEKTGTKAETCTGGVYVEMSGCMFDASVDYSCYKIPTTANATCPAGATPQAAQQCAVDHCVLCNTTGGLPGGGYYDSAGALRIGYCTCQVPNADGIRTWTCASDTQWPCPLGQGCGGAGGAAGTSGRGGSGGTGRGGAPGAGGQGGGGGLFNPSCSGLITAMGVEPTKGGACTPSDPQLCYKTCGPEKTGAKYEACSGGAYLEMSGCSFDPAVDYSCYKIPTAANATCPAGAAPQAATECAVDHCVLCNTTGGLPGGGYYDSAGAVRIGYCTCQAPNADGKRTWTCASDTQWPCPLGLGCGESGGRGGTSGRGGAGGSDGGGGGGQGGGGGPFSPSCSGLFTAAGPEPTKGGACTPSDPQLCYKTCGPERTGSKSEICTGGVYAEMSGCAFPPNADYSCYKIPTAANATCPAGVTPQASQQCTADHCVLCNSVGGLPGGAYLDASGAARVGYCTCQLPNAAGTRTWSCASDTAWPCPAGTGC